LNEIATKERFCKIVALQYLSFVRNCWYPNKEHCYNNSWWQCCG